MRQAIIDIIKEINPYEDIDENSLLIDEGILDSLTLVILINELEEKFNIKIPEDNLQPEMFETVSKIEDLVKSIL
jgi:acyl carrier protein